MKTINFNQFLDVELRVGTIIKAEEFPEAKNPAYKIWVDFGSEIGIKKSSAQITHNYQIADLIGMQIIGVVNFEPKQIGNFMSEFLITGFKDTNGHIVLANPQSIVPNGNKLI